MAHRHERMTQNEQIRLQTNRGENEKKREQLRKKKTKNEKRKQYRKTETKMKTKTRNEQKNKRKRKRKRKRRKRNRPLIYHTMEQKTKKDSRQKNGNGTAMRASSVQTLRQSQVMSFSRSGPSSQASDASISRSACCGRTSKRHTTGDT